MIGAILLAGVPSRGEGRGRVALIGADAELAHALEVALTPWGVTLIPEAIDLGAAPPTLEGARALALTEHTDAVVWLAPKALGPPLACMYDAGSDRLLRRALGVSGPFDDTTAAAAALTIKAMLRSSVVAPPEERGAPSPADSEIGPPPAATSPGGSPAPSSTGPTGSAPPLRSLLTPSAPRARPLEIEAGAGIGLLTTGSAEARVALGAAWFPSAWGAFGIGANASLGGGASVRSDGVDARLVERSVGLALRRRLTLGASFALEAMLGAALDWTAMAGTAGPARGAFAIERVDPSLDAALRWMWHIGVLDLGASADLAYLLRSQRYSAEGVVVARLASWQPGATLWLDASLF
jgi:hypothetical protein